jgi:hypothetical protein
MPTCRADGTIERQEIEGFKFPLGVYPVEPMSPRPGYTVDFEPADGGNEDDEWEEWPDRYVYEVVISADRLEPLCRRLFSMFPGRVYPILDVLGTDAYREVDPFISYELIGLDRFLDAIRRFRDFFYEDGMCGFGAMSEEPFVYIFVDEHKIVMIRIEPRFKERVEKLLETFDLKPLRHDEGESPAGADAAAHEHRTVLLTPRDAPNLLGADEVVEELRDDWQLVLNVDPETNVDDEGKELGGTTWRCVVRAEFPRDSEVTTRYAEIVLDASNLRQAETTAAEAVDQLALEHEHPPPEALTLVNADRLGAESVREILGEASEPEPPADEDGATKEDEDEPRVRLSRWMGDTPTA